jgi:putative transposase
LLKREGFLANHKKILRLYREEGLRVRRRGGRKRAIGTRAPLAVPTALNQCWALDFVSDALVCGRRFRVFVLIDQFNRECLALVADTSISGKRVARELDGGVRPAGDDCERQGHRTDLERHPALGAGPRRGVALHRTLQAAAKRF